MEGLVLFSDYLRIQLELWKPIEGFPGYDVSNTGRVRGYRVKRRKRVGYGFEWIITSTPAIMRAARTNKGYWKIVLCREGRSHTKLVHRLVAAAFIPNPKNLPEVNHRTGIKTDNRLGNLEWADRQTNSQHACDSGLAPVGERHHRARLTADDVRKIRKEYADGETGMALSKTYGVSFTNIYNILRREAWKHVD